jgi:dihydropteroate synthase
MNVPSRIPKIWQLQRRVVELGARTLVMGVVNVTPDSFSDGGIFERTGDGVAHALAMLDEGADLIDLGGESTRPGSLAGGDAPIVNAGEEQARVLPVLEGILKRAPQALISVDTYKAATARAAIAAGAAIINDVSGLTWDADMAAVCAEAKAGVILMHTRGRPDEWKTQQQLAPAAVLSMVRDGLATSISLAQQAGIRPESIILDPGYGFGKRFGENFSLLKRQADLLSLGYPLLAGISRKSFLGHTLASLYGGSPAPVDARENASLAAMVAAILHGASLVRVHAVRPAVEAARIADALLAAG